MVLPAAATTCMSKKKVTRDETSDSDSDEIESFEESDTGMDVICESNNSIIDDDNDLIPTDILRSTWETLSPSVPEENVLGKWYAVIYATKQARHLCVGKMLKCFLLKENGDVDCLEVPCLKPKVRSGTLLEDTPTHLPDVSLFKLADVVYGPLEVILMKAGKFDVPESEKVVEHFDVVKDLKRNSLL